MVEDSGSGARDAEATPSGARPSPSRWVCTAWAEWAGWRGPPELVAQVARAALWAVSSEVTAPLEADCSIALRVAGDVERFSDPSDFREHVTPDGLRHFSRLDIRVHWGDDDLWVRLSPWNVKLGRPGVVVLASAAGRDRAEAMRDAVAASIGRRTGRNRELSGVIRGSRVLVGEMIDHPSRSAQRRAAARTFAEELESDADDERGDAAPARLLRAWRALVDPFEADRRAAAAAGLDVAELEGPATRWTRYAWQAVLLVWASAFVLALTGDPDSGDLATWGSGFVVACAVLGAAGWAIVRWVRPQVEVTPTSRLQRILSLAWKGLLAAAVSAAVGKSIELLVG